VQQKQVSKWLLAKPAALPDLAAAPKSRSCVYAKRRPPGDTLGLDPLLRFIASYGAGFEKLGLAVPHVVQLVAESESTEIVTNPPDEYGDEMIGGCPPPPTTGTHRRASLRSGSFTGS
jgi:hypothetical protein